ncbi:nickel insertion protein [Dermabacter sp. HSID17554]|uniref:nickel insertion protein n=1 Tax=Dermabacter sp. HSID17554 TaxID=2419511 RepID=UPI00138739C1|nr:nickel insertion protein [Dermabacter sp. HSID17554]
MHDAHDTPEQVMQLEANVDDADPRLWPGIIDAMLEAGALDCWLTPIIMKHGRPAVTVHALARLGEEIRLADRLLDLTGSLGVRYAPLHRRILTRRFEKIEVEGVEVAFKIATRSDGSVATVGPEFRDVQVLAQKLGITEREALRRARDAYSS